MNRPIIYLHVPVSVPVQGRAIRGELYLPKAARALRLCIVNENRTWCQRLGSLLTNPSTATLTLRSENAITTGELLEIVAWVRSRRLLGALGLRLLTSPLFGLKSAHDGSARRAERRVLRVRAERQILPTTPALAAAGR
jgi:hypothetical protein